VNKKGTFLLAALAALAVLAAACTPAGPTFEQEFEGITGVVLNTTKGNVTINGADQTTTQVTAAASFSDAEQFDIRVEGGLLIIGHDCGAASSCSVDYVLTLPEATPVEVTTVEANVTVSDVKAFVAVTTTSGNTFVRRIEGNIVVGTGTGQITGTQNRSATASFTASEESDISVSFDQLIEQLRVDTERGDVTLQLIGGPYSLEVDQGAGSVDIKIEISETSPNNVSVRTGRGNIKLFQN